MSASGGPSTGAELDDTRERNLATFEGAFGRLYSYYIERERLSRIIAVTVWGGDIRPFYASMRAIGEVPDGGVIIDAPCGAGVAFRALRREQHLRYVAVDLSPRMLARAGRRAARRGLSHIEFVHADAEALPLDAGIADLFLSYWGLHCFLNPQAALREAARCLRPGGLLVGATFVKGKRLLDRLRVRPGVGAFGRVGSPDEMRRWLAAASLTEVELDTRGVFGYFRARSA